MVDRYQDLIAWQLAEALKREAFRLVRGSPGATRDFKFRSQLIEAARGVPKNIVEGFLRFRPREFQKFLDYAAGSIGETEGHLQDGIELEYFSKEECEPAFRLARRCLPATVRLKNSQERFLRKPRPGSTKPRANPRRRPRRTRRDLS